MRNISDSGQIILTNFDALLIVDVQNDFIPGGSLPVPDGDKVIEPINRCIRIFSDLEVIASKDWHPEKHCSFQDEGGSWPVHCVQGTKGAEFAKGLKLPREMTTVCKGTEIDYDAYSAFKATGLSNVLYDQKIRRLFVCGLATDYCVLETVVDACDFGFHVFVLEDCIKAVNINKEDELTARRKMSNSGASFIHSKYLTEGKTLI